MSTCRTAPGELAATPGPDHAANGPEGASPNKVCGTRPEPSPPQGLPRLGAAIAVGAGGRSHSVAAPAHDKGVGAVGRTKPDSPNITTAVAGDNVNVRPEAFS